MASKSWVSAESEYGIGVPRRKTAAGTMHMLGTENEPHISWPPSRKRLAHNYTSKWLGACLRFNPNKDRLEPQYQKDKEISDINALLAPLRTCHNFIAHAWPDKTSTRRHLHLAFERRLLIGTGTGTTTGARQTHLCTCNLGDTFKFSQAIRATIETISAHLGAWHLGDSFP